MAGLSQTILVLMGMLGTFLLAWVLMSQYSVKMEWCRADLQASKLGQDLILGAVTFLVLNGIYYLSKEILQFKQDVCIIKLYQETSPGARMTRPNSTLPPTSARVLPMKPPQGPGGCGEALENHTQVLMSMKSQLEGCLNELRSRR